MVYVVIHTRNGKHYKRYVSYENYVSLFVTYERDCRKVNKGYKTLFFNHKGEEVARFFIKYKG